VENTTKYLQALKLLVKHKILHMHIIHLTQPKHKNNLTSKHTNNPAMTSNEDKTAGWGVGKIKLLERGKMNFKIK